MPEIAELKYLLNPYLTWAKAEDIPIHEELSVDLATVATRLWRRYGVDGALVHLEGRGDFMSLFLLDISAGSATVSQGHLFEAMVYVLSGSGRTELLFADGSSRTISWGPRSLFALPLNAKYRHINTSRDGRARLASFSSMQVMMNLYHDANFIFFNDANFPSRVDAPAELQRPSMLAPRRSSSQGLQITDAAATPVAPWPERGLGIGTMNFDMADSTMHAQVTAIEGCCYEKASRFCTEFHILPIDGEGYTLIWRRGETSPLRMDWAPGLVFAPPRGSRYQHFNIGAQSARYLSIGMGSLRYPFVYENRRIFAGAADTPVADGGDQIEYNDQSADVRDAYAQELKARGLASRLE